MINDYSFQHYLSYVNIWLKKFYECCFYKLIIIWIKKIQTGLHAVIQEIIKIIEVLHFISKTYVSN